MIITNNILTTSTKTTITDQRWSPFTWFCKKKYKNTTASIKYQCINEKVCLQI